MYTAIAIRILDPEGIRANGVYIITTNSPLIKQYPEQFGWTMQEDLASEKYGISDLQIDESKAINSHTFEIVSIGE